MAPSPNIVTLGIRASTYEWGEGEHNSVQAICNFTYHD